MSNTIGENHGDTMPTAAPPTTPGVGAPANPTVSWPAVSFQRECDDHAHELQVAQVIARNFELARMADLAAEHRCPFLQAICPAVGCDWAVGWDTAELRATGVNA